QNEIYDGTVNIYENIHSNGYEKVKAVETQASAIDISSNPLKDVSLQKDKIGVCHQLCNESKFKWMP
uniref:ABC-three component system protein n=1 Tax=Flavonifractor plautii TaxID=292800 RepID=UPI003D7D0F69